MRPIPPLAGTPAEPAVVALYDQTHMVLDRTVQQARDDLAAGWNPIRLTDVLSAEMLNNSADDEGRLAQAILFAMAVVDLARLGEPTEGDPA